MTTLPTTPKVKTLIEQTPTLEKWESKTLAEAMFSYEYPNESSR